MVGCSFCSISQIIDHNIGNALDSISKKGLNYEYIKYEKNQDTIYCVVIQSDMIINNSIKFIKITGNKFIYKSDSLNYEVGRFAKKKNKSYQKLASTIVFYKKIGCWKCYNNGIITYKLFLNHLIYVKRKKP